MASRKRTRRYESPLREEQHAATRTRLVDAVLSQVRAGASELSMTQIARDARVAIPTVYRHFPARRDLLVAMAERVHELVPPPPWTGDLPADIRAFFHYRHKVSQKLGPIGSSPVVWEFRREVTVPVRRAMAAAIVDDRVPRMREPQRTWLIDLVVVFFSDMMASAFRGYLDLDPDASADRGLWALDAFIRHALAEGDARVSRLKRLKKKDTRRGEAQ